jgi:hypothetical protein
MKRLYFGPLTLDALRAYLLTVDGSDYIAALTEEL